MIPPEKPVPRKLVQIIFAPRSRNILLGLLIASVVLFATARWLVDVTPENNSGTAGPAGVEIEVPFSSEQPVVIRMSHDFHLVSMSGIEGLMYYYVDGPDVVNYTINITDPSGQQVESITGQLSAPESYSFKFSQRDTMATVGRNEPVDLAEGRYSLSFDIEQKFTYQVIQKNKFETLALALGVGFVLAVIGIIGVLALGYNKWERENRPAVPVSAPVYYPPQPVYYPLPVPATNYDPGYYRAPGANIVQDEYTIEYMCAKCGNMIQNPVINNVITCEQCGEREYVGQRPY